MSNSANNGQTPSTDMDEVVAQANQIANTVLLALRTVHEYIAPRAESHGIKTSARDKHAWSVSLSIALSQSRAYTRMPTTRFDFPKPKFAPAKKELFSRPETPIPFSDPAVLPALRELRELLKRDSVEEREIIDILREATPRGTVAPISLDATPGTQSAAPFGPVESRPRIGRSRALRFWRWCGLSALKVLSSFETAVLDGLPTGKAASELLDRLKGVESLIAEVKAHYKEELSRDSSAVPGWFLQPGAIRRSITDPLEAYRRVSDTLRLCHGQDRWAGTPVSQ
jgi:hypothetical protein